MAARAMTAIANTNKARVISTEPMLGGRDAPLPDRRTAPPGGAPGCPFGRKAGPGLNSRFPCKAALLECVVPTTALIRIRYPEFAGPLHANFRHHGPGAGRRRSRGGYISTRSTSRGSDPELGLARVRPPRSRDATGRFRSRPSRSDASPTPTARRLRGLSVPRSSRKTAQGDRSDQRDCRTRAILRAGETTRALQPARRSQERRPIPRSNPPHRKRRGSRREVLPSPQSRPSPPAA